MGCSADRRPACGGYGQPWLLAVLAGLVLAACGSGPPTTPSTHPAIADTRPSWQSADAAALLSPEQASDVTLYAIGLVGTPYRYGGNTPQSGFDCSGLIAHVYQTRAGIQPPRTVSRLRDWGQPVAPGKLRSGDLAVFFQNEVAIHAGIYVGEGRFVHAPSSGGKVRLDALRTRYWAGLPVVFRRP